MIRSDEPIRFTPTEVEEFRQVGLDLGDARHQSDIEHEVSRWVHTLAEERFDLLEKIALEMAKAKGVKLPRLAAIFTTTDNGRLRGHAGASLGKTGLAVAINEMLKRRSVAEWLRRGPVGRASWTPAL